MLLLIVSSKGRVRQLMRKKQPESREVPIPAVSLSCAPNGGPAMYIPMLVCLAVVFLALTGCGGTERCSYLFQLVSPYESTTHTFEDSLIVVDVEIVYSQKGPFSRHRETLDIPVAFLVEIVNKTASVLSTDWNECSWVDMQNRTWRLLPGESRPIHSDLVKPVQLIPPGSKLQMSLFPTSEEEGLRFPPPCTKRDAVGSRFSIAFPVMVGNTKDYYNLAYKITGTLKQ